MACTPSRQFEKKPRRAGLYWGVSVLVAVAVGGAGFFWGGFEYQASVTLWITEAGVPAETRDRLRQDWLNHVWQAFGASDARWRVDRDETRRTLSVSITSPNPEAAQGSLARLAATFVDRLRTQVEQAGAQPGPDERVLTEFGERLRAERTALVEKVGRLYSALPPGEDEAVDGTLGEQLAARRAVYAQTRRRAQEAEARLAALNIVPLPEHVPVDVGVRERAIQDDVEIQQDLKALRLQLAEARQQLLLAGQAAAPALEETQAAVARCVALCYSAEARSAAIELRRVVERISRSAADYQALWWAFLQAWTGEFERLRTLEDDPRRAEVLEAQATLEELLRGFLFQSAAPLGAMRENVRVASTVSPALAEHHELISALVRAFHGFQSAHHRFEFAAGDLKPANNFRLDAALKSAKGLRQRSRARLAQLEERLSRQALDEARADRERRSAALKEELNALRHAVDESVETLLATQEQADTREPALRSVLQSKSQAGAYEERIVQLDEEIRGLEDRRAELAARRWNGVLPEHLQVGPCRVDRRPTNVVRKLLQGALAGLAALGVLGGARMMLSPRGPKGTVREG